MGILNKIWDKNMDGNKKEPRSLIRVSLIAFFIAIVFLCVKRDNIFQWIKAGITISRQNKEIEANRKILDSLDRAVFMLNNDRDSLETYAREHFHFAQKGDDIYLIKK